MPLIEIDYYVKKYLNNNSNIDIEIINKKINYYYYIFIQICNKTYSFDKAIENIKNNINNSDNIFNWLYENNFFINIYEMYIKYIVYKH